MKKFTVAEIEKIISSKVPAKYFVTTLDFTTMFKAIENGEEVVKIFKQIAEEAENKERE